MSTIQLTQGDHTVAQGAILTFTNEVAFNFNPVPTNAGPRLIVAGEVRVMAVPAPAPGLIAGVTVGNSGNYGLDPLLHVTPTGVLRVDATATGDRAIGVTTSAWAPRIVNDGLIEVTGRASAEGMNIWGASDPFAPVTNNGVLRVTATEGGASGVSMPAGDRFLNNGRIEVTGAASATGVAFAQFGATFRNDGEIVVVDANPFHLSIGVLFSASIGDYFYNRGLIQAEVALKVASPFLDDQPDSMVFQNVGRMVGAVDMGAGGQRLFNAGSIDGAVDMGDGFDIYDGQLGTVTGLVSGGGGPDSLLGGAAADYLQGNSGQDTVVGGGGGDAVLGGRDDDLVDGGEAADVVYGNIGADTCEGGAGDDVVRGGQGDDVVRGGAGADFLAGDRDNDTLTGGAGADIFHTFGEAGGDRVTDFSAAEGDRVQLAPGVTYSVSQFGADTVITMAGGGRMVLVGVDLSGLPAGWIFGV